MGFLGGIGDFLFGTKPKLETEFIQGRVGDIPIGGRGAIPFLNPLFGITGQQFQEFAPDEFGQFNNLPEGAIQIAEDRNLFVSPFDRSPINVDTSFLNDIQTDTSGTLSGVFNPADLVFPDTPTLPDRISAPGIPGAPTSKFTPALESELLNPSFGANQFERRLIESGLDFIKGQAGIRDVDPSVESQIPFVAEQLSKFRGDRINRLQTAETSDRALANQAFNTTMSGITSIFGTEVAQRSATIAGNQQAFDTQVRKVTELTKKKAELMTRLKEAEISASTERARLQTQLEIARVNAELQREQNVLSAATSLAQISQGNVVSGVLGGSSGLIQTAAAAAAGGAAAGAGFSSGGDPFGLAPIKPLTPPGFSNPNITTGKFNAGQIT